MLFQIRSLHVDQLIPEESLEVISLSTLLREARRHPLSMARAIVRRALEIPRRGLPDLAPELKDDFDQRHGVDTSQAVHAVVASSTNLVHGVRYQTSNEEGIRWSIENCGLDPRTTTFLDIGCGKGRVLIIASSYPFPKIVGVDYSPELTAICTQNLKNTHTLGRCTVVNEDAEHFALPDGDLCAYMFNPFKPELLRKILARLADHPAKVALAYRGPGHDTIRATGAFEEIARGEDADRIYRPRRALAVAGGVNVAVGHRSGL
jgi:SAM-dependent methyltransferase